MIRPRGFPGLPSNWILEQESRDSLDQEYSIFFNIFKNQQVAAKRALVIVHGQGEHGMRYQHFPHYLQQHYDWMLAVDLRGHGRSEGLRGYVDSFDDYADDAILALHRAREEVGSEGTIDLFGHSMGGLVSLRVFKYQPNIFVKRCVLSSPLLQLSMVVPFWKDKSAEFMDKVWPTLQLTSEVPANYVSHDPEVIAAYQSDKLNHNKATPRFYCDMKAVFQEMAVGEYPLPPNLPFLFQVAGDDRIVSLEATKSLYSRIGTDSKTWIEYPQAYHEIFNETIKEKVFQDLKDWLNKN